MRKTLISMAMVATGLAAAGGASAQDWTGFHVGGFAGYSKVSGQEGERLLFDTNQDGTFGDTVRVGNATTGVDAFSPGFCDGTPDGNNAGAGCSDDRDDGGDFGARVGYDWQFGNVVFGLVGEFGKPSGEDAVTGFSTTPANYSFRHDLDYLAAARVRLGLATGRFLPYVTGGFASGNLNSVYESSNTANSFTPSRRDDMAEGFQVGGGVETMVTSNLSLGLEYIYTDLEVDPHVVRVGPGSAPATNPFLLTNATGTDNIRSGDSFELHSFRVTAGFRF